MLDGDELREIFSNQENKHYDKKGRVALALKYSKLCHMLSTQNLTVIIATISLYKEVQKWNRENISNYYEVFLDVPLEELKRRDPKRIYERFFLGEIKNVAGLDVDIDLPIKADFVVKNGKMDDNESLANEITQILIEKGFA